MRHGMTRHFWVLVLLSLAVVAAACEVDDPEEAAPEEADPLDEAAEDDAGEEGEEDTDEDVQEAVEAGETVLGAAMIDLTHPFFVRMQEAGNQASEDYGVTTSWQSAEGSLEQQISIIENFIEQGVDAIMIDPLDAEAVVSVIGRAEEAGIPVVTMGNKVEGEWNVNTLYPDYDNMAMVGRALATSIGGEGEVALLVGSRGNFVSDTREAGFTEALEEEFPDVEVVAVQPTDFDPAQAQDVSETWLTTYPDLEGIACISDPLCLSAMSSAEAAGRDILFAGYDGDEEMHPMLEDGSMVLDVLTGAERVGYWNVAVGARLADGAELDTDLFLPTFFITTDETAQSLSDEGLELDYVTPEESLDAASGYAEQFGPDQPDDAMTTEVDTDPEEVDTDSGEGDADAEGDES